MQKELKIIKALPDILSHNLKILFIGYNPGITSAEVGHHYAHKSNRFWKLLCEAGLHPSGLNTIPYAEQLKCFAKLKNLKGGEIMNN